MPLPEPFSDIEHLQLVIRRYLNKQIREDFKDKFGDSDTWEPEVGTTRGAMLRALLHEDSDPIHVTTARMMLYYFTYGKAQALQTFVYQAPYIYDNISRVFKPQITLYFRENYTNENKGKNLVQGELSFRLMHETSESLTMAELRRYATQINTLFANNRGFVWRKGKICCTYRDIKKGYDFRILSRDITEGKRIIEQLLDIQNHTPDWQYMYVSENQEPLQRYPANPGNTTILGRTEKKPVFRPIVDVRFKRAYILIWSRGTPITLVDITGQNRNALIAS